MNFRHPERKWLIESQGKHYFEAVYSATRAPTQTEAEEMARLIHRTCGPHQETCGMPRRVWFDFDWERGHIWLGWTCTPNNGKESHKPGV